MIFIFFGFAIFTRIDNVCTDIIFWIFIGIFVNYISENGKIPLTSALEPPNYTGIAGMLTQNVSRNRFPEFELHWHCQHACAKCL
jgi:hypothetical protein